MAKRGRKPNKTEGPAAVRPDPERFSPSLMDLSSKIGVSYRALQRWRRLSLLAPELDGTWSIEKALLVKQENAKDMQGGDRTGGDGDPWKARKLRAQALQEEMELRERLGRLVDREHVQKAWELRIVEVRNALQSMGRDLAPRLHGKGPREIQSLIDAHVFHVTNRLADPTYCPTAPEAGFEPDA